MYRKHSRSLQSAKKKIVKFSPSKSSFYHCLDSAFPPRSNERDPNSRAVKMHRKEKKKGKRKEENFGDLIAKNKQTKTSPWAKIFPW